MKPNRFGELETLERPVFRHSRENLGFFQAFSGFRFIVSISAAAVRRCPETVENASNSEETSSGVAWTRYSRTLQSQDSDHTVVFRTKCELVVELIREQARITGGRHLGDL